MAALVIPQCTQEEAEVQRVSEICQGLRDSQQQHWGSVCGPRVYAVHHSNLQRNGRPGWSYDEHVNSNMVTRLPTTYGYSNLNSLILKEISYLAPKSQ